MGPNGVGKTTLARITAGCLQPTDGQASRKASVCYVPQEELRTTITVGEYLAEIWDESSDDAEMVASLLTPLNLERLLTELSGGEWMRARLAKALSKGSQFLILDEPTNNLDRAGKDTVLEFLKNFPRGILVISHDQKILTCVETVLELSNRGISVYGGNFELYWDRCFWVSEFPNLFYWMSRPTIWI